MILICLLEGTEGTEVPEAAGATEVPERTEVPPDAEMAPTAPTGFITGLAGEATVPWSTD